MSNTPTETDTQNAGGADTRSGERNRNVDTLNTDSMKWLSGLVALVGLWIAVSPYVYEATETATWNNLLVGAAILVLAAYNFYRMANDRLASVGIASLAALLGLWALASPFVLEMGAEGLFWSTVVSGLIVAALSGYNAYANQEADARAGTRARA